MDRILVRAAAVRILFVVLLVLVTMAGAAHAAPSAGAVGAPEVGVAGALFTPTRHEHGLEWRALWVLTPEAAEDIARGATRVIRFAAPLTEAETIDPIFGATPLLEDGKVVGVLVDSRSIDGRLVSTVVRQRVSHDGSLGVRVGAPVASGHALQIIDGDLTSGMRLEIEVGRTLERHVGYVAPPGVSRAAREEARRLTGYDGHVSGAAIYVRGDDVKAMAGLTALVETPRARGNRGAIGVAVVFGAVLLALFAAVRKLRHAASVERADAILAAEVDALDGGAR